MASELTRGPSPARQSCGCRVLCLCLGALLFGASCGASSATDWDISGPTGYFYLAGMLQALPYEQHGDNKLHDDILLGPEMSHAVAEHLLHDAPLDNASDDEIDVVRRAVAFDSLAKYDLWPNAEIPYVFAVSHKQDLVRAAMREWERYTPIRFIKREPSRHRAYVAFGRSRAGFSFASPGYDGGRQHMNLAPDADMAEALHELGHVIGLQHEHQRPDRDDYVRILKRNIRSDYKKVGKRALAKISQLDIFGRYDSRSIMHYDSFAFGAAGKPTILKRGGGLIPRNTDLSRRDKKFVAEAYQQQTNARMVLTPRTAKHRFNSGETAPWATEVKVKNRGRGELASLEIARDYSWFKPWLTVKVEGRGNNQRLINIVDPKGVKPGRHLAIVRVTAPNSLPTRVSYDIEIRIEPSPQPAPSDATDSPPPAAQPPGNQ